MPGKRAPASKSTSTAPSSSSSLTSKTRSSSNRLLKPSLLSLAGQTKQPRKAAKSAQKARDTDAREKLDKGGMELREALTLQEKKALVKKQEAPPELAKGGDQLANSLDDLSVAFGAA